MSSAKQGESLPRPCDGPYYSRYTEHKVVLNFRPLSSSTATSTPRARNAENYSPISRYSSTDSALPPQDKRRLSVTGETVFDFVLPADKNESSDGPSSPFPNSPSDFRAISPKFNIYSSPLSTFRSGSLESTHSQSSVASESAKDKRSAFSEKNSYINNSKPRGKLGKFASAVQKHSITIFTAAAFKLAHENSRTQKLTVSCPELLPSRTSEVTKKVGTESCAELASLERTNSEKIAVVKHKLTVPDIFTTSFTHSKDSCSKGLILKSCSSQQDVPSVAKIPEKAPIRRAISLTKNLPQDYDKTNRLLSPTMYKDEQLAQVTEYLFIGSIESAYNDRRLCRLEIESLVDISNLSEMQVPAQKKLQCPCLCQTESKHFRSKLIIAVPDEENDGIDQYFEEVNKFIEGARRCTKKVLIYSLEGKSRAALFAIQYLIEYEGLLLRQAYSMVKKQRPQVSLNPSFQRALEKLEKSLYPDERHSVNICNEYLNVADPQAIKCAWIDC
ncbi:uncharacterized protein LOC128239251 [Mya arenaria]|uniref:uncharacterized protein LOC128239251 n=1 Tax=Mya arenaria TaxID=6604 RepID=UPI0022E6B051|nr:uncharacterized protein LOC128239251 [Mya arenaria]